ncbi:MAG: N-acetylmuramoyl-L-alanine amidase [Bacillota bacterium]
MQQRLMMRAAVGLVVAALLAACGSPAEIQPPPAPEEKLQPALPPLPEAADLRRAPALGVTTTKRALGFTGRGPWYLLVAEMEPGAPLTYLGSREGWLWVELADGRRAWVVGNDTTVTDGRQPGGAYQVRAGHWEVTAPSGLKVEVTRQAPGVMRVAVTSGAEVVALDDRAIALLTPAAGSFEGALDVGDGSISRVSVSPQGVLVDLDKPSVDRVIARTAERVEVEFRPGLERVERLNDGWRFAVRGESRPVLRPEADALVIDFPAADNLAGSPAGLSLEVVGPEAAPPGESLASARASIPVRMAAGGLRLRPPLPQQPYALSQPEPGLFELRWIAPGLKGKRVVLDPGHGGEETGAVGLTGAPEKDLNLMVALRLKSLLEAEGAEVIMTRTEDRRVIGEEAAAQARSYQERTQVDLQARSALANRAKADLVLSIHANGGPPGDGGTEVFWAVPNLNAARSRRLAALAQEELVKALGLADRGVKQRPFNVIRYSDAPAVLVELGFLTNPAEEALLFSEWGQEQSAQALLRAVREYLR